MAPGESCGAETRAVQPYSMDPAALFGGVKAGGIGRELGGEGVEAYVDLKAISGAAIS